MFDSLDSSDTTVMGRAREAVAFFLVGRDKAISFYEFSHLKYIAAMCAGSTYNNAQDLVSESTEKFRDLLYNIKGENRTVQTPEDVRALWEKVMGKPWPTPKAKKDDKKDDQDDTDTLNEDN